MNRSTLLCLAFAAIGTPVFAAQGDADVPGWTDRQFEFALDGTSLLRASVTPEVFNDADVMSELRRTGLPSACAPIRGAIDTVLKAHEADYRAWAMPTLRNIITPAEAAGPSGSIAPSGYHEQLGRRLMARMRRERPDLLPTVEREAVERVRGELASLPAAVGDWRGRFADWNFDRMPGLTHRIACSIEGAAEPDQAKLAFDGFYKTGGN